MLRRSGVIQHCPAFRSDIATVVMMMMVMVMVMVMVMMMMIILFQETEM
jgi:hypothetical protein